MRDIKSGEVMERELYDYDTEPIEIRNLAGREAHQKTVEALSSKLIPKFGQASEP